MVVQETKNVARVVVAVVVLEEIVGAAAAAVGAVGKAAAITKHSISNHPRSIRTIMKRNPSIQKPIH